MRITMNASCLQGRTQRGAAARSLLRRLPVALVLLLLLSGATAPRSEAQWTVIDPAHIAKTVWNGKKIVDQIRNQKRQIENEIEMLKKLPNPPWRTIRAKMQELNEVMRAGEALAYSMDGLLTDFGMTFPGFRAYADWSTERRQQFDRSLGTFANVMMSLQKQGQHFQVSQGELDRIKDRLGNTDGQTSAIELGNTIGAFTAEELMLIRQLLATQANTQAVQAAYQINVEAQRMAMQEKIYYEMANYAHPTGRGYSGILSDDDNR